MVYIIGTHDGFFHADEVFAVAALAKLHPRYEVRRTRDPKVLALCDAQVDVGGVDVPQYGRFDHHQPGRAGFRENGVSYSSFGLVWKHLGYLVVEGELREKNSGRASEIAALVDAELVQPIDAHDNGQEMYPDTEPQFMGVTTYSVSKMIAQMNPNWNENGYDRIDDAFTSAVMFAGIILDRAIAAAVAKQEARGYVLERIAAADGGNIITLDKKVPWADVVHKHAPDALFVVYPSEAGTWMCQALAKKPGSFEVRYKLPTKWAGLQVEALQVASGVEDAVFCHPGLFACGARSRKGALKMAVLALQG